MLERIRAGTPITLRAGEGRWKPLRAGIEVKPLQFDKSTGTVSFLLRAQPGAVFPSHGHQGIEECLVLEGEITIGDLTLRVGDYHVVNASVTHAEASTRTGAVVYVRATADDYPMCRP